MEIDAINVAFKLNPPPSHLPTGGTLPNLLN